MKNERRENLMPNGVPRYIRCYDNGGETWDRYTVVFTGKYRDKKDPYSSFLYIGASSNPFHPQGFGTVGESQEIIDRPAYSHLGKKTEFALLPPDVQVFTVNVYKDIWNLCEREVI